jgi:hypothetical protein
MSLIRFSVDAGIEVTDLNELDALLAAPSGVDRAIRKKDMPDS